MKRINYILIMLFLVSSLLSCKHDANEENQNSTPIPDLTAIANFAKYSTIGVGTISKSNSRSARNTENNNGYKVIGHINKEDDSENLDDSISDYEVVEFISNTTIQQDFYISSFRPIGDLFIAFQFSRNPVSIPSDFSGYSSDIPFYLLDKKTGKIYKIPTGLCPTLCYSYFDISDNAIFAFTTDNNISYDSVGIYKFSIINSELAIEKIIDDLGWKTAYITTDRYGNIFTLDTNFNPSYLITSEKKLRKLENTYYKSLNGFVYTNDFEKMYDSTGNIVDALYPYDQNAGGYILRDEYRYLLRKNGLTYYFESWDISEPGGNPGSSITKITFSDNRKISYTSETINFDGSEKYVIANDNIYFLKEDEIFYISLNEFNGVKHTVASDYLFKSISTDGFGNIYLLLFHMI